MALTVLLDLFDISKRLLVRKDTPVNFELVHRLMIHGKHLKKNFIPIPASPLFRDFKNIFNEEQYFTVFTPERANEEIIEVVKNTHITKEIVEELLNIKNVLPYTFRHTLLVTALSVKIALDIKDGAYDPKEAALTGLTHDLGKSRIPKSILGKDTPLTQSESMILKTHSLLSYLLLSYYLGSDYAQVIDAARDHHEKLDGGGYPRSVAKIGKYARLITPIDIFDALVSERPYRGSSFTIRQALDYLINEANAGRIDREMVHYLISYVRKEHPRPDVLKPYENKTTFTSSDSSYGKVVSD